MLVLLETPAGFALFKVLDEGKLSKVEELWKEFSTSDSARKTKRNEQLNVQEKDKGIDEVGSFDGQELHSIQILVLKTRITAM
ncbi:Nucleolar protein 58/56, N-terminal [Dillenia turbinata]|uniref:Nucleolar protein 58/56, N-terminal n=1 Tax=Dillenia turbinata TaxID=194707 RepID=A0AAN8VAT9_9MAGN